MTVIDEYLETLTDQERDILSHMYSVVRATIPDATEELSYNMPAFKWQGKGVIAILSNKNFMSIYPFCNLETLGLELGDFEGTKGSIHFSLEQPVSDELLKTIITARQKQITES